MVTLTLLGDSACLINCLETIHDKNSLLYHKIETAGTLKFLEFLNRLKCIIFTKFYWYIRLVYWRNADILDQLYICFNWHNVIYGGALIRSSIFHKISVRLYSPRIFAHSHGCINYYNAALNTRPSTTEAQCVFCTRTSLHAHLSKLVRDGTWVYIYIAVFGTLVSFFFKYAIEREKENATTEHIEHFVWLRLQ
jgi:hypothetical protein